MSRLPHRLGQALTHPVAAPLVVGGAALVVWAVALLLLTYWLFFAFLWGVPIALGARQAAVGVRVADGQPDAEEVASAVRLGLIAAALTLNPVAFAATWVARARWAGASSAG